MKLTVNLKKRSYDVIIKKGALNNVGKLINLARKVLIVTDDGVPEQYAKTVQSQCKDAICISVPQGEKSKSIQCFEMLLEQMLKHKMTRKDLVIAVGGGVVGDLAGFVASAYMRGVDFVNCPTTTLAQIDSSIGGKVAVNLAGTKNTVGAFHQPKLVVIDPNTLDTLSQRQYAQGLAEAVKAGLIADEQLFEMFETADIKNDIEKIIYLSLEMKKRIVQEDEHEGGIRAILNFGHTIGHGIESAKCTGHLYHGECVALGMLPMIEDKALQKRTAEVLKKLGLPFKISYDGDEIYKYVCHDKKAAAKDITVVKVQSVGTCVLQSVPMQSLRGIIKEGVDIDEGAEVLKNA